MTHTAVVRSTIPEPISLEGPTGKRTARLRTTGPHTERYLTDPATRAPADLRTLLRYPVTAGR